MKRTLNRFSNIKLEFGDYILFQEYVLKDKQFHISKPIMAIYLGMFIADQTSGFNYVRWNNDNHIVYINNENVKNYPTCKEVSGIESHIEWDDYIDILGVWKCKPKWKDIIKVYRTQNKKIVVLQDDVIYYDEYE